MLALQVLIRYVDPSYEASSQFLTGDAGDGIGRRVGGAPPLTGATPLASDYRSQIGATLARLAAGDPDASVRRAALRLRQVLARDDASDTPLAAGSISLVAACGSEITLRSIADVDVELALSVPGTPFARTYGIRAGTASNPTTRRLAVPNGTVIAEFGGREVARLSERNGKCAPGQVRW